VSKPSRIGAEVTLASREIALEAGGPLAAAAAREVALLNQCRRGDPAAFARLVDLHESMVYNLAARLLGDAEEARDLSQEVFLQVYRSLGGFRGGSSLRTWIYRIVVNQSRNRRRFWKRRRRERSCSLEELKPSEEPQLRAGPGGSASALEELERAERSRGVQQALLTLSFEHRAVLLLREVEELSCAEIGASLGLAEGTVKSRLSRAREALRVALQRRAGKGER
jgi:RNA polymerase sigma-70 factor, ECF subfamily